MKNVLALMAVAGLAGAANADIATSTTAGGWAASPGTGSYTDTLMLPAVLSIDKITVTMSHTWSNDLVIAVNGAAFSLINRPATGSRDLGVLSGTLQPAEYFWVAGGANVFGALAGTQIPSGPTNEYNAVSWTGGAQAAGGYTISISDAIGGDGAVITGWSIHYTVPAPGAAALLGLGGLLVARRRR